MFPSEILQPPPTNSQKFSRGVSFEAGVLRRYYRRRVIMDFTSKGPAEAKSTNTLRRIHLIRRQYAKRRGRRETMLDCFFFDCPLSKTVKILDQRSRRTEAKSKIRNPDHRSESGGGSCKQKEDGEFASRGYRLPGSRRSSCQR
jgi:hypothetical protein